MPAETDASYFIGVAANETDLCEMILTVRPRGKTEVVTRPVDAMKHGHLVEKEPWDRIAKEFLQMERADDEENVKDRINEYRRHYGWPEV